MYIPKQFEEPSVEAMHALIRAHPLATVVTLSSDGLNANHVPLHLSAIPAPYGTLRGHIARSNPLWRDFAQDAGVLAIFQGPDAYISPSWYPTKKERGKVVPTWNYVAVHAYGSLCVVDDASWIRTHLEALTVEHEASFAEKWLVSDAPREYIDRLIGAVVGIEIVISKLAGKWKVSQNQPLENRAGAAQGLILAGSRNGPAMAALVEAGRKTSADESIDSTGGHSDDVQGTAE
ncbi:MAG: FMN-binding negative transcriptional regulator [Gammaproteobacteria bacterium]